MLCVNGLIKRQQEQQLFGIQILEKIWKNLGSASGYQDSQCRVCAIDDDGKNEQPQNLTHSALDFFLRCAARKETGYEEEKKHRKTRQRVYGSAELTVKRNMYKNNRKRCQQPKNIQCVVSAVRHLESPSFVVMISSSGEFALPLLSLSEAENIRQ